jgi:adenosylcobinamide kinase/adenosylcobinamide-phosphate guanylyltransferase
LSHIILVTGGNRSGKSDYALQRAEALKGPRAFVATCPVIDEEMAERIRKHKLARDETKWSTIEEPVNLAHIISNAADFAVLLVDCLTLWINNLLYEADQEGLRLGEEDIAGRCREVLVACDQRDSTVIFVTNEVGMGLVPEVPDSRLYRDLVGRCNQIIADAANEVVFMVSGIPLKIKE